MNAMNEGEGVGDYWNLVGFKATGLRHPLGTKRTPSPTFAFVD